MPDGVTLDDSGASALRKKESLKKLSANDEYKKIKQRHQHNRTLKDGFVLNKSYEQKVNLKLTIILFGQFKQ